MLTKKKSISQWFEGKISTNVIHARVTPSRNISNLDVPKSEPRQAVYGQVFHTTYKLQKKCNNSPLVFTLKFGTDFMIERQSPEWFAIISWGKTTEAPPANQPLNYKYYHYIDDKAAKKDTCCMNIGRHMQTSF